MPALSPLLCDVLMRLNRTQSSFVMLMLETRACTHIRLYTYHYVCVDGGDEAHIYIYIYIYSVCVCVREREGQGERERECVCVWRIFLHTYYTCTVYSVQCTEGRGAYNRSEMRGISFTYHNKRIPSAKTTAHVNTKQKDSWLLCSGIPRFWISSL